MNESDPSRSIADSVYSYTRKDTRHARLTPFKSPVPSSKITNNIHIAPCYGGKQPKDRNSCVRENQPVRGSRTRTAVWPPATKSTRATRHPSPARCNHQQKYASSDETDIDAAPTPRRAASGPQHRAAHARMANSKFEWLRVVRARARTIARIS